MAKKLTAAQRDLLDELVGGVEIAEMLGVSRAVVSVWQKRYEDFPTPLITLSAGRFYRRSEVLEWHRDRFPS